MAATVQDILALQGMMRQHSTQPTHITLHPVTYGAIRGALRTRAHVLQARTRRRYAGTTQHRRTSRGKAR